MKKKLAAGGVVLAALALIAVGTLAYLVSEGRATNTITTGTVTIVLNEYSQYIPPANPEDPTPTDATAQPENVPYQDPEGKLVPGDAVDKIPVITNTGTADCWVRMQVNLAFTGDSAPSLPEGTTLAGMVGINYDTDHWVQADGWYYYKTPLAPGADALPLFNKVNLKEQMGNEFQNTAFDIDLQAEAIQSKNNSLGDDHNYAALWANS